MARRKAVVVDEYGPTGEQLVKRSLDWLVPDMVPLGAVTSITGPSDSGKSTLCCALAADVAGGPRFDGGSRRVLGGTLWYSTEEDPSSMVRPKLNAAQCPTNGYRFPMHDASGALIKPLQLPAMADELQRAIEKTASKLVVMDPPFDLLEPGLNPNMPQDASPVMMCLNTIAAATGAAIVLVLQPNKRPTGSTTDKIGGARVWVAKSRVVLRLGFHPSQRDVKLLTFARYALGKYPPARVFRFEEWEGSPRFVLGDKTELGDNDAGTGDLDSYEWEEQIEATEWLRGRLEKGPVLHKELWREWQDLGFTRRPWWKARKELGVKPKRSKNGKAHTVELWIPDGSEDDSEPPLHSDSHTGVERSDGTEPSSNGKAKKSKGRKGR